MKKLMMGAAAVGLLAVTAAGLLIGTVFGLGFSNGLSLKPASQNAAEVSCPELHSPLQASEDQINQPKVIPVQETPWWGQKVTRSLADMLDTPLEVAQERLTLEELMDCPGFRLLRKDLK